jgi:hypothetical protein|nr:MAG TPA: hypothetical protein [Caudoviricetes sp.]
MEVFQAVLDRMRPQKAVESVTEPVMGTEVGEQTVQSAEVQSVPERVTVPVGAQRTFSDWLEMQEYEKRRAAVSLHVE